MSHNVEPDSPTENNTVIEHTIHGEENAEETLPVGTGVVESTISYDSVSRESSPSSLSICSEEVSCPTDIFGDSDSEPLAASESIGTSSLRTTVIQFRPRGKLDKKSVTQPKKPKKKDSQGAGKPNPPEPVISLSNPPNVPNPPELPNFSDPHPHEPASTDPKSEEGK